MKLIDVTNSHSDLVTRQLENTDSNSVRVYSVGPCTVIHTIANSHENIVIVNKVRPVRQREIDFIISKLLPNANHKDLEILNGHNFIEIELKSKVK